jgi:hypothetical protein
MSDSNDRQEYSKGANVPENPGPNALGHTPLIGSVRRSNDIPVIRDRAAEEIDELDAVDLPDKPVLPFLSTE